MNRKLKTHELNRPDLDKYKGKDKIPLIVVLDNIRSLNNIGSVFRTSDAFLVEAIYLCGYTATPPNKDIQKTALGATESVSWRYFNSTIECINELKKNGYFIASIEQTENSLRIEDINIKENPKIAIVLGNEVKGVQQEVIDNSHCTIEIPQYGTKHSLNVSVCGGIIIWELFKKLSV